MILASLLQNIFKILFGDGAPGGDHPGRLFLCRFTFRDDVGRTIPNRFVALKTNRKINR